MDNTIFLEFTGKTSKEQSMTDYNLIGIFCVTWIALPDLCRLDSALCNREYREVYLNAIRGQRLPETILCGENPLRVSDDLTRDRKNILPLLYQWLGARAIYPTAFDFLGKLCPCYGQIFTSDLLREVRVLNLLGDSKVDHAFFKDLVVANCRSLQSLQLGLNSLHISPKYIETMATNNQNLQSLKYYAKKWVTCEIFTVLSKSCKRLQTLELISVGPASFVDPGDMLWHFPSLREIALCNYNEDSNLVDVCMGLIHGSPLLEVLAIETQYNETILERIAGTVPMPQLKHITLREPPGDLITSSNIILHILRGSPSLKTFRAGRDVIDGPAVDPSNCFYAAAAGSGEPISLSLEYLDVSRRIHNLSIEKVMVICGLFPNLKEFAAIIKAPLIERTLLIESFPSVKFRWSSSNI